MGWFSPGGGTTDPIVVEDDLDRRLRDAPRLSSTQRTRVQQAVRGIAPQIGRFCGRGASVDAEVLVDASGQVIHAVVDESGLGRIEPDCVKKGLLKVEARGVGSEGKTDISFKL